MKVIAPIAVLAIILLQWSGSIPQSSVGGPMTIALVFFAAAFAVAIHEAWTMRRGVLGWVVNIVTVFIGAFLAAELGNLVFELLLPLVALAGPLVAVPGFLPYGALAVMMLLNLLGAWTALKLVNRWR